MTRMELAVTADAFAHDPLAARLDDLAAIAERTGGEVTATHEPFLAQVSLRLDPALADRVPFPLPLEPNACWEEGERAALWLGPDEWLVLGPPSNGAEIAAELDSALDGLHYSVVDVSANRVAIEIGGPGRFELLSKGCTIDLHSLAWAAGMCAQTLLAKTQVLLHERADTTRLLVRPSFADYLVDWLLAATTDWSVTG
ncbi:MAG: sarcosine oxidase subunit gamma family protein [Actinomycetota bacterium]